MDLNHRPLPCQGWRSNRLTITSSRCRHKGQTERDDHMITAVGAVRLAAVMERTRGLPEVAVGLIDGPVALDHPELSIDTIHPIPDGRAATCSASGSPACMHGTFVAGMLSARRGSLAPAICPGCSLLVRPIFTEHDGGTTPERSTAQDDLPSATAEELAEAVIEVVNAGARVLNLSAAIAVASTQGERELELALDYAARRGALVVAAAGNQATVGSTVITRHRWVIPVVGCDVLGRPMRESNLASSFGRRGLRAPGENITSLAAEGEPITLSGTSFAAPFVTGALALLWSEFPDASAAEVKLAVTQFSIQPRKTLLPPLLDAWSAYKVMAVARTRRKLA